MLKNNKTQIRSLYFKSRPNNNPQTFEAKCFKVFRKRYAYPREAKDLNLLLNKRKHTQITQKMDKDRKQF